MFAAVKHQFAPVTTIRCLFGNRRMNLCRNIFINVSTCFSEVCGNDACHRSPRVHAVVPASFHWVFSLVVQQNAKIFN